LEHNALLIAILATITIAVLSLSAIPKINMGLQIKSGDKILHILAYFSLSIMWFLALHKKFNRVSTKFIVIASLIFYGIILEVLQGGITDYRTSDIHDVIANIIGILLAATFIKTFIKWLKSF
jgi:VanZ family protein